MTLRHIRIFLAVCSHDYNITRAAESLYMTQPAVSLAIRELEDYYRVRLFERISRKLYITKPESNWRNMLPIWFPCLMIWNGSCGTGILRVFCGSAPVLQSGRSYAGVCPYISIGLPGS